MDNQLILVVDERVENLTISEFLKFYHQSRANCHLLQQKKLLLVNRSFKKFDYCLQLNDVITIDLPFFEANDIRPFVFPIDVVYEDDVFLIVNKKANVLVHPDCVDNDKTLINMVKAYYIEKGIIAKPRYIHRLDYETSGLIVFAKNFFFHRYLDVMMSSNQIERSYLAICFNLLPQVRGTIDSRISQKKLANGKRFISFKGLEAITHYEVVKYPLVKVRLETGRTHQIRLHFSSIGCPLAGDVLYGVRDGCINRVALHSYEVTLRHPIYNRVMMFKADIPKDMRYVLELYDVI